MKLFSFEMLDDHIPEVAVGLFKRCFLLSFIDPDMTNKEVSSFSVHG